MTTRPILMSGPMVRAILDGRKTQTRRIVKTTWRRGANPAFSGWRAEQVGQRHWQLIGGMGVGAEIKLPYASGDLLWVKEGWAEQHPCAVQPGRDHRKGRAGIPGPPGVSYRVIYREEGPPLQVWRRPGHPYFSPDGPDPDDEIAADHPVVLSNFTRDGKGIHWDSARYMPRQFSRLTLRVTDVRVQRLQAITKTDARAEGIEPDCAEGCCWRIPTDMSTHHTTPIDAFRELWDGLNAKRGYGWDTDPYVVAVSFEAIRANVDAVSP